MTLFDNVTSTSTGHEDTTIMILINISVLSLGSIGIILNGFSLYVLWKCMTTGQLGIKLVLLSDLVVCVAYVTFNVQSNIVNHFVRHINHTYIVQLATVNRLSVHVTLFVSNWWIIALLLLRVLTIFSPINVKSWDKMLYHRLMYLFCWIVGIVVIVPLHQYERYTRPIIYVIPVLLVSVETGMIIYGIRRVQTSKTSPKIKSSINSYQEIPCSSSNSSTQIRHRQSNVQTIKQPYNNIVLTILLLALNFLILDSLLFIDTLHSISKFKVAPLPAWFMLLINIFSLSKRILNFVILCAKCRHFRKIMLLKLNLISRYLQKRWQGKFSTTGVHDLQKECLRPALYAKGHEFILRSDVIGHHLDNYRYSSTKQPKFQIGEESFAINSYYSAFEMMPCMSHMSTYRNRLILSARY